MAVNLLICSNDLDLSRRIQASTKYCSDPIRVFPCSSFLKLRECIEGSIFDAVLVEETLNDSFESTWIKQIRSNLISKGDSRSILFFLLSRERNPGEIRLAINQGFKDLFIKPVDISLVLQKLQLYLPRKRFLREDLLFTMGVDGEADLLLHGKIIRASEFGVTILTTRQLGEDDILTMSAEMLTEPGASGPPSCLARVIQSVPVSSSGKYETTLAFIGSNKRTLTAIRVWLRRQYIMSSSEGKGTI